MADLGIARMGKEADLGGTLTRADLADVVHNRLGLSRAESAQLVERVLHHMCHSLSEGKNVPHPLCIEVVQHGRRQQPFFHGFDRQRHVLSSGSRRPWPP